MHGVLLNQLFKKRGEYSPIALFKSGEQGVWYDPSDLTTLYQDAAGTTPVTSPGDPVGLMLDKSQGLELGPELVVNGDFSNGTLGWGFVATAPDIAEVVGGRGHVVSNTGDLAYISQTVSSDGVMLVSFDYELISGSLAVNYTNAAGQASAIVISDLGVGSVSFYAKNFNLFRRNGACEFYFDNVKSKELKGSHAYQTTSAARPLLGRVPVTGRRNLNLYSEDFENSFWAKDEIAAIPIDDYYKIVPSINSSTSHRLRSNGFVTLENTANVHTCWWVVEPDGYDFVKVRFGGGAASFQLSTETLIGSVGASGHGIEKLPDGTYLVWVSTSTGIESNPRPYLYVADTQVNINSTALDTAAYAGDGVSGVKVYRSQTEEGSIPNDYQKVVSGLDVTEQGVRDAWYLQGDGVDDYMRTPPIDFTLSGDISVFAGQQKESDGATKLLMELSPSTASNDGSFYFAAPANTENYQFLARGTVINNAIQAGHPPPDKSVLFGAASIQGQYLALGVNGVTSDKVADLGVGTFGNHSLHIGGRLGGSFCYVGKIFGVVVIGSLVSATQRQNTEQFLANKAGVTL